MEDGSWLISPQATVEAEAQGTKLAIHGTFSGIAATERVELTSTANMQGKM
jgi:cytoskeletal protein CcmA (bactofilin family)